LSNDEVRFAALVGRCSDYAKEQLMSLRNHPLMSNVMDHLEGIPGRLYASDVEKAVYEVVKRSQAVGND
jgi:hypothetical protein